MQPIDIHKILSEKAPGKHIPGFVIRYLERIVHVRELNELLAQVGDKKDYDFLHIGILDYLGCKIEVHGEENMPTDEGPYIFVSNHPLGGLDGMIEALTIHQFRPERDMKIVVNDLLMNMTPLQGLFMPVNKVGAQSRAYAEAYRAMWESGVDIMSFPAGLCSRLGKGGKVMDLEWKSSFVKAAKRYQRVIIPIYFDGQNSMRFYRLAQWRKRLGIKLNIEMLFLSDEMFRQKGKTFHLYIGKAIQPSELTDTHSDKQWAEQIKQRVYQICKK